MIRYNDDPKAYRREYMRSWQREWQRKNKEKYNASHRKTMRRKYNPEKARRIEEAAAYYRAEFPPIDGVILDDNRTRLEIYYSRDGKRFVTERCFETAEDCKIHYTAVCDLLREDWLWNG